MNWQAPLAWWRAWKARRRKVLPPPHGGDTHAAAFAGRFRLERRVGAGATGEVWQAWDGRHGRRVALKLWAGGPVGPQAQARFEDELRVRRRLDHAAIQAVLDAGSEQGRPWMALQWVEGDDLSRFTLPAARLPQAEVARLGARIAHALAHAHRQGVLHRDLKPANVLLDPTRDELKLIDFGVARHEDDPHRTRTGTWVGTPAYMAPELLAGQPADARTDLYALGVMLFELLASRRPFDAPNLGELLRQVATAPVPDLRSLRPELDPALADAVTRALARDPAARWPDANSLAQTLHRLGGRHGPGDGRSEAQSMEDPPASLPSSPPTR